MRRRALAAAALAMLAGTAEAAVPVRVGGVAGEDACATVVQVDGIGGHGFLAVRDGPGLRFRTRDRLGRGRSLAICEERGLWVGVVYGSGNTDCGVSTPRPRRAVYTGPCRSGWVYRKFVRLLAG